MNTALVAKLKSITELAVVGDRITPGDSQTSICPRISYDIDETPEVEVSTNTGVTDAVVVITVISESADECSELAKHIKEAMHYQSYVTWGDVEILQSICTAVNKTDSWLKEDRKQVFFKELEFNIKYEG